MSENTFLEKLLDEAEIQWVPLGDVARILNGYSFKSSKYSDVGIRVIRISDVQKGKMSDKNQKFYPIELKEEIERYLLNENDLVMSLTGNAGRVAILSKKDLPAGLNQRVACIRSNENTVLTRFLFHFLDRIAFETEAMNNATGAGQKNLSTKWLAAYAIPIPCPENPEKSLAIQAEIVRILDTFTELTAELTAELISELTARKKQFNYYRDQLLTFEDGEACLSGRQVEWKTLGEVLTDKFWIMPATPKFDETEEVPYITSKNIRGGNIDFNKVKFISRKDFQNLSRNRPILAGDFLISMIGTIGEVARVKEDDLDFYGQNMYLIRLNPNLILSGYFLHFFDSPKMKRHFNGVKNNSGQGYLKANNIENIRVPIPPLAEQARIVAILDKFDTLTHSISEGLPREIELRQKQYEYYRDLLLNFPKTQTKGVA